MLKDKIAVKIDTETPAFVVRFWDVSKEKLKKRGHDVTSHGVNRRWAKHYFEGNIKHVQSGKNKIFHSVSEFHAFVEKHRI